MLQVALDMIGMYAFFLSLVSLFNELSTGENYRNTLARLCTAAYSIVFPAFPKPNNGLFQIQSMVSPLQKPMCSGLRPNI